MCSNQFQEAEEQAAARETRKAQHAANVEARAVAAAEAAAAEAAGHAEGVVKSPSDFSCQSYELFVGQEKGNVDDNNREKMSIVSETLSQDKPPSHCSKVRKVSTVSIFYSLWTSLKCRNSGTITTY